jgi:hypothetical protein
MNSLQRLIQDQSEKQQRIDAALQAITDFRLHLDLDKFKGHDSDGQRKDWIAKADVLARLTQLEAAINGT